MRRSPSGPASQRNPAVFACDIGYADEWLNLLNFRVPLDFRHYHEFAEVLPFYQLSLRISELVKRKLAIKYW